MFSEYSTKLSTMLAMVSPEGSIGRSSVGEPGRVPNPRSTREGRDLGIPQAALDRAERFRRLPQDAAGFVSEMTSSFGERDLAVAYLSDRSQRQQTAEILQAEGVRGRELGLIMRDLQTLAEAGARSRR